MVEGGRAMLEISYTCSQRAKTLRAMRGVRATNNVLRPLSRETVPRCVPYTYYANTPGV